MKIAIVTSYPADPDRPHGGVEAVCVNLVMALARHNDLELHVVTVDRQLASAQTVRQDGLTIHRLPWAGGSTLTNAIGPGRRQMHRFLTELKPHLVHAHDTYGLMVKNLPLPRVFTVHGFIYGDTLVSGTCLARLRSMIWRRVEQAGWTDQPHIISISPYVRQRVSQVVRSQIHDIDNPVAESFFDIPRHERPGAIFSAALICPRKNTLALVEAFGLLAQKFPDAELRLAGMVSNADYGRRVEQRIGELGLRDRVKLLGSLSSEQVRAELAGASVFALVSLEENAPVSLEEAMAAGVPVVASNRCGMPYMVDDGESGYLVDPGDVNEIASRLNQLLGSAKLRSQMGSKGRQIALKRFHPDAVADQTRNVYLKAVAGVIAPEA